MVRAPRAHRGARRGPPPSPDGSCRWRRGSARRMDRTCAPRKSVSVPPASRTMSAAAAVSHGLELPFPEAVEAAAGDVAEVERRRADAPHVARPRQEVGEEAEVEIAGLRRSYGKPVASNACSTAPVVDTWIGAPLSVAPPPRRATKVSSRIGSCTMPSCSSAPRASASDTAKCGRPCAKFTVPSSGSRYQAYCCGRGRSSAAPDAASSATMRWSGKARRKLLDDQRLDGAVGVGDQIDRPLVLDAPAALCRGAQLRPGRGDGCPRNGFDGVHCADEFHNRRGGASALI